MAGTNGCKVTPHGIGSANSGQYLIYNSGENINSNRGTLVLVNIVDFASWLWLQSYAMLGKIIRGRPASAR